MEITAATIAQRGQIRALWAECFPDETFQKWFFANLYREEYTVVALCGGQVAAMALRIPQRIALPDGRAYDVTYIYGACTAKAFRRQGLMAAILRYTFALDEAEGKCASVLIPQEEWLFGFYEKFGYQPVFRLRRQEEAALTEQAHYTACRVRELDLPLLQQLYEVHMFRHMHLLRGGDMWSSILSMYRSTGGEALVCMDAENIPCGYLFGYRDGNTASAQEVVAADDEARRTLLAAFAARCGAETVRSCTPDACSGEPFGCMRVHFLPAGVCEADLARGHMNLLWN